MKLYCTRCGKKTERIEIKAEWKLSSYYWAIFYACSKCCKSENVFLRPKNESEL